MDLNYNLQRLQPEQRDHPLTVAQAGALLAEISQLEAKYGIRLYPASMHVQADGKRGMMRFEYTSTGLDATIEWAADWSKATTKVSWADVAQALAILRKTKEADNA